MKTIKTMLQYLDTHMSLQQNLKHTHSNAK